jgi:NitT/TauT family transport system substrate-binding protein
VRFSQPSCERFLYDLKEEKSMKSKRAVMLQALMLALILPLFAPPRYATAQDVTVQLDWIFGGKHVAFFVARDRGMFKDKGLNVKLLEGKGSQQAATRVDAKQADIGYGDLVTALEVIAKGGSNRAIAVGQVFQGGGYIFLEESGIKVPKDLEGKNFGTTPGDFGLILLPALGASANFDHKKVVIKNMDVAVRTPALFERKIDFLAGARGSSIPRMAVIGKREGKKINYLFFKDMGLNTYAHVLQVREDRIKGQPDMIQRFVTSLMEAWAWSVKNPDQALDIFMKANPEKDKEISLAEMKDGLNDVIDPESKQFGLGYMREEMMKRTVDIANKYLNLSPAVDYKTIYTNQFIKKTPGL